MTFVQTGALSCLTGATKSAEKKCEVQDLELIRSTLVFLDLRVTLNLPDLHPRYSLYSSDWKLFEFVRLSVIRAGAESLFLYPILQA